jgi:large subunit ribosomal protein L5
MARLKEKFRNEVATALKEKFSYKNVNQVPKLEKIILNCVTREAVQNGKVANNIAEDLTAISGQKAVIVRAKQSVASFKLREGQAMGATVTLRGNHMYEFLDRLVSITLPRVRDFRGVNPKGFDGKGNYTLGMKEQIVFPEINYDKVDKVRGLGISFVTSANTNEEGRELLANLGMPFKAN